MIVSLFGLFLLGWWIRTDVFSGYVRVPHTKQGQEENVS